MVAQTSRIDPVLDLLSQAKPRRQQIARKTPAVLTTPKGVLTKTFPAPLD
jgi:hypothetical protein